MSERESWLNGWKRHGDWVGYGGGIHCAGCGSLEGMATVIVTLEPNAPEPAWPFDRETCPLCKLERPARDVLADRALLYKRDVPK